MSTRIRPAITVLFVAVLSLLLVGVVPSAGAKNDKGKICHRTGSSSNPYVVNSPSKGHTSGGHSTHPSKGGRSDAGAESNAPKGPTRKSGYSCEGEPAIPPPPPPPPPPPNGVCVPPDPACPNGEPVIPPTNGGDGPFAGPAEAIGGQPTVTG